MTSLPLQLERMRVTFAGAPSIFYLPTIHFSESSALVTSYTWSDQKYLKRPPVINSCNRWLKISYEKIVFCLLSIRAKDIADKRISKYVGDFLLSNNYEIHARNKTFSTPGIFCQVFPNHFLSTKYKESLPLVIFVLLYVLFGICFQNSSRLRKGAKNFTNDFLPCKTKNFFWFFLTLSFFCS